MSEKVKNEDTAAAPIRVNGEVVPESLVEQELELLRERYAAEMSWEELEARREKVESDARENAVERLLLTQKARAEIADVAPEVVAARYTALKRQHGGEEAFDERFDLSAEDVAAIERDITDSVKLEAFFDQICAAVPRPTEQDARTAYEASPSAYAEPERVRASHILIHPEPGRPAKTVYVDLLNARERLLAGADFNEVADELSACADGHDLGWFARGQMVRPFEEVAFATPVNAVSDVFQTEFGYHVLQVFDRAAARTRPFEEVRYDIEGALYDERKNAAIGAVADELRAAAEIENLVIVEG